MITLQNLIPDFSKKLLLKAAAAASVLFLSVTLSAIPSFAASAYDNLAVANVTSEPLNMRTKPSTAGEIVGKCYRGAGGTVLERKDGWTKVRSGKIEGWVSDKYLLFGTDIEPLAKELGLLSAKITATTLNVRETPSTDSAILKQTAEGDSFPVLSESDGWTKVQLSADTNGYISSKYASIGPVPAAAVDAKEESAALSASGNETSAAPSYVISATEDEKTPLQKEMDYVSKILGIAVCVIAVVVLVALAVLEGFNDVHDVIDSLLLAVSLAVAAVPEGLAAILTVVLALGVQRMAAHNAIVKKLHSVETLGSASVICSDKTGTLTRNEMTVERVVTPSGEVQITGTGYAPEGRMVMTGGVSPESEQAQIVADEVVATLVAGTLANDGELREENGRWEIVGDPTEVSLIVAARKVKADRKIKRYTRVGEIPFTSERKRMSIIAKDSTDSDKLTVFAKGAPDVLLSYCTRIRVGGQVRKLTEGDRQSILATVERLSSEAYRTLGEACRPLETGSLADVPGVSVNAAGQVSDIADQAEAIETDLIWNGMVGIIDPPRTEVRDSVTEAHRAGIRTVMITGDHPLTAARIASDLGIIAKDGKALTGDQLDQLPDEAALDKATSEVSVYARVAPEHKLKIVESLQRQGNIVAMTGDGVNDAPAVKSADIGVAMGITGTEVTKQSAKMILADDNFSTIVAAVREGRVIFDNIRKFLRYLLSSNVGEVFTVFLGVVFAGFLGIRQPETVGVTVPLLATQLLWINLLTDAAPALAMGVDPQTDDVMGRKPRKVTDRVIDASMWGDIIYIGVIMAIVTLIGMDMHLSGGLFTDRSVDAVGHEAQMTEARTMGFTILVFAQLFNALASRSHLQSAFVGLFSNKWLWGAIGLSVALQLVVIYVPFLNGPFGTVALSPMAWVECICLAAIVLIASELRKIVLRAMAKR